MIVVVVVRLTVVADGEAPTPPAPRFTAIALVARRNAVISLALIASPIRFLELNNFEGRVVRVQKRDAITIAVNSRSCITRR